MAFNLGSYIPKPVNPSPVSALQLDAAGASLFLGAQAGDWLVIDDNADALAILTDAAFNEKYQPV